MKRDLVIIGGGPAGLAAAVAAYDGGIEDVLILERDTVLGGVLNQCIHNGFGLTRFRENLTGPEYAAKFVREVSSRGIEVMTDTMVMALGRDKTVTAMNRTEGVFTIEAKAVILAMGCRERSKGALNIAGTRPAGLYSAGTAQRYVNLMGYLPGREVVILGSGDIGLIMARRMTLEGAHVAAVLEIMPYSSGLKRNIVQCLDDFGIPLYLSHTIVEIRGKDRVTGVTYAKVDEAKRPIPGTETELPCDTVLFSVGLIPENELTAGAGISLSPRSKGAVVDQYRETDVEGIFSCGNVLQVHDLVDFVSEEAELAGRSAADYILNGQRKKRFAEALPGKGIGYVLPQKIDLSDKNPVKLFFRVAKPEKNAIIKISDGDRVLIERKKRIVSPGEMETVVLSPELLAGLESGAIRVEVADD